MPPCGSGTFGRWEFRVRPLLCPGLSCTWRSPDTVQFGIDVPHPIIVSGLPPIGRPLLESLDGVRTEVELIAALIEKQLTPPDGAEPAAVLTRLIDLGVIVDGGKWPGTLSTADPDRERLVPDLRAASALERWRHEPAGQWEARGRAQVTVIGASRLGATLGRALAAAGVGRVEIDDARPVSAADVSLGGFAVSDIGRRRSDALTALRAGVAAPRGVAAGRRLTVVTDAVDTHSRCRSLGASGASHLVVSCRELMGRVGPLVQPGESACQFCLELTRRDIDPGWAHIWRQRRAVATPDADAVLVAITANLAAAHVLDWLTDGQPPSVGGVIDVTAPHGATSLRRIARHPECGCAWPGDASSPTMGP